MAGAAAGKFVTREEFDSVKAELQKLIIRVEVLTHDLHRLTLAFGEFGQHLIALDDRLGRLEDRVERLEKTVIDGNAALMSAILSLGRS